MQYHIVGGVGFFQARDNRSVFSCDRNSKLAYDLPLFTRVTSSRCRLSPSFLPSGSIGTVSSLFPGHYTEHKNKFIEGDEDLESRRTYFILVINQISSALERFVSPDRADWRGWDGRDSLSPGEIF